MPMYGGSAGSSVAGETPSRPVRFAFAGDSIGQANWGARSGLSPLWWAATELYHCEYETTLNSAVGGTSSSHLIDTQIAQLEALATKPDVVIVQSVQNDYIGSTAQATTFLGYMTQYAARALAAGVRLVVLCSRPPKNSTDSPSALNEFNRRLEHYCRTTPGTLYCDVFGAWRRTTVVDGTGVQWRGTAYGGDAFSDDGTHPTALAGREAAPLILPVLERFARRISPLPSVSSAYDDTNWRYNNVFGPNGLMLGTSGQYNGADNANVPGNSTGAYDRWFLTDGNGITATPSIVVGPDGYRYLQMTLSGTATATASVVARHTYIQNVASGTFVSEAMIRTSDLTGVRDISWSGLTAVNFAGTNTQNFNIGTKSMLFRTPLTTFSNSGFATRNNGLTISVANGVTVSGSVLLGRCGLFRLA